MNLNDFILYVVTVLIWGSTWIGIKFQLSAAHPALLVGSRFLFSGILLMLLSKFILKASFKLNRKQFFLLLIQSFFLFCFNYLTIYLAEGHLTSGIVCILFSLMVIFNGIGSTLFFGEKLNRKFWMGASLGLLGILTLFSKEIIAFKLTHEQLLGVFFTVASTLSASIGNLLSKKLFQEKVSIYSVTSLSMLIGSFYTFLGCLLMKVPFQINTSSSFYISFFYLSIFGSIVAFLSYFTLLKKIGPAKAAYSTVVTPLVAISLSLFFHEMQWSITLLIGAILCLLGNVLILKK